MLVHSASHLRVRWRSPTNAQGLPSARLAIWPSQNVSSASHVLQRSAALEVMMTRLPPQAFVAFVGIDWADTSHAVCLQVAGSETRAFSVLTHT
jgi:hypothetical protein